MSSIERYRQDVEREVNRKFKGKTVSLTQARTLMFLAYSVKAAAKKLTTSI